MRRPPHGRSRRPGARDERRLAPAKWTERLGGVLVLVAVGAAVDLLLFRWSEGRRGFAALDGIDPAWTVLAVLLAFVPWITNPLRVMVWTRFFGRPAGFANALRIALATDLAGAVAPTAVGGGPAKAALLVQSGLPPGTALLICAVGSLEDVIFFTMAIPVAIVLCRPGWSDSNAIPLAGGTLSAINEHPWLAFAFAAAIVAAPLAAFAAVRALRKHRAERSGPGRRLGREPDRDEEEPRRGLRGILDRVRARARRLAGEMHLAAGLVLHEGRSRFVLTLPLVGLQWIARYSVITLLLHAMGFRLDPFLAFFLQWIIFTVLYVTPIPGAVGGAGAAFVAVFSAAAPGLPMAAAAGWRALTFYAPILAAAAVFLVLERRLGAAARRGSPRPAGRSVPQAAPGGIN